MARKNIANETATVNFNEASETTLARTIMQNATRFWNKIIAVIPIKLMRIDISYQRQLSANINKLVTEWGQQRM